MKSPFKFGDAASDIKDIKIHSDSIEIVFDVKLLAAEATIPPADISYDKEKEQRITVFDNCNAVFDTNEVSPDIEVNPFLRSIDMENNGNECILKLGLNSVRKYHMKEYSKHEKLEDPGYSLK